MKRGLLLGLALIAGAALAVPFVQTIQQTQWFQGGAYFKSQTGGKTQNTAHNLISDSSGSYFAYDFPQITSPVYGSVGGSIDGPTITKAGVLVGDVCSVTSDRSIWDGGKPMYFEPRCEIPANGFILLRGVVLPNDAGLAVDPVDAGYYFRTFGFTAR